MNQEPSTSSQIRKMILKGHTNKSIIDKLGCKPQNVYNMRYQLSKKKGIGALPTKPVVKPVKVKAKVTRNKPLVFVKATQFEADPPTLQSVTHVASSPVLTSTPSLWERIKRWIIGV